MAEVQVVEGWVRVPGGAPIHRRVLMVIAARWAEQRVLMRAFASAANRSQPCITLRGRDYSISPSTVDGLGPWGIHVPDDEEPEALKEELERASRARPKQRTAPSVRVVPAATKQGKPWFQARSSSARGGADGRRTLPGFASPLVPVAPAPRRSSGPALPTGASVFGRSLPPGLELHPWERQVLEVLARKQRIREHEVVEIVGHGEATSLMHQLIAKLHAAGVENICADADGYRLGHPAKRAK